MVYIPFPDGYPTDAPVTSMAEELFEQRRLTIHFIAQDPTEVVLIPRVKARTPSGAYQMTDGTPRPLQKVKMVYGGNTGAGRAGMVSTGDGRERMFSYVMVGAHDAVFAIGDHFVDEAGQHWEVEELLPDNDYEVKATVRSYGGAPQYG